MSFEESGTNARLAAETSALDAEVWAVGSLARVLYHRVKQLVAALEAVGDHAVHASPDAHTDLRRASSLCQLRFGQTGGAFALAALASSPRRRRQLNRARGEYIRG